MKMLAITREKGELIKELAAPEVCS